MARHRRNSRYVLAEEPNGVIAIGIDEPQGTSELPIVEANQPTRLQVKNVTRSARTNRLEWKRQRFFQESRKRAHLVAC
jgi:hypothetical protein